MEPFKLEIDSMRWAKPLRRRSLQSRFVKCKLVMLALMWMQHDEDQQRIGSADYSSPLLVDNSEWWDRNGGPDVEDFRKVSNTVRIGAWDEVMLLRLVDLLSPNPTCLHDASYYALVAIAMYLVDGELEGKFINPADQYFARRIVYQSLQTVGGKYFNGTDSFSLTGIEDSDSLMWGLALHYLGLEIAAVGGFGMGNSDIDEKIEDFLSGMDDVERAEFDIELGFLPDGYFQCKPYIEKWTDRTVLLSKLIHRVVYYVFVGHGYDANRLDEIMSIPFNSRVSTTFQSFLVAAVYRIGYFITNSGVEEWQEGRNWLLYQAFSNLLPFYERGRKDGAKL